MAKVPPSGLMILPPELLGDIVSRLCRSDQAQVCLVCSTLRQCTEPLLWRTVLIRNVVVAALVRHTVQTRPAVAALVMQLDIHHDYESTYREGAIYTIYELITALPKLKHLTVETCYYEDDRERSDQAAESFAQLSCLESCDLLYRDDNGENWTVDDLPTLFNLIHHPTMKEFCLRRFKSSVGVVARPPKSPCSEPISTIPMLKKLSFWDCDMDVDVLSEMLAARKTQDLEYLFLNESYPPIEVGFDDPDVYMDKIANATGDTLERLTFYRNFDGSDGDQPPFRFQQLRQLKHLRVPCSALLEAEIEELRVDARSTVFNLPQQLEVLTILVLGWQGTLAWGVELLDLIVARRAADMPNLRQLRFCTDKLSILVEDKRKSMSQKGALVGLEVHFDSFTSEIEM